MQYKILASDYDNTLVPFGEANTLLYVKEGETSFWQRLIRLLPPLSAASRA